MLPPHFSRICIVLAVVHGSISHFRGANSTGCHKLIVKHPQHCDTPHERSSFLYWNISSSHKVWRNFGYGTRESVFNVGFPLPHNLSGCRRQQGDRSNLNLSIWASIIVKAITKPFLRGIDATTQVLSDESTTHGYHGATRLCLLAQGGKDTMQ
jgi:hypothetical protein